VIERRMFLGTIVGSLLAAPLTAETQRAAVRGRTND
jgi:hypothetical protein